MEKFSRRVNHAPRANIQRVPRIRHVLRARRRRGLPAWCLMPITIFAKQHRVRKVISSKTVRASHVRLARIPQSSAQRRVPRVLMATFQVLRRLAVPHVLLAPFPTVIKHHVSIVWLANILMKAQKNALPVQRIQSPPLVQPHALNAKQVRMPMVCIQHASDAMLLATVC